MKLICLMFAVIAALTPAVEAEDRLQSAGAGASKSSVALKRSSTENPVVAAAFGKPSPTSIDDLKIMEDRVKALVRQLSPAVVAVEVGNGSGSGVVISADGIVLTAGHVVDGPNRAVRMTFSDGKTVRGRSLGVGKESDVGLIKITQPGAWPHAEMGDLKEARTGDWVLAMGNPGGFDLKRSLVVRLGRIILLDPEGLQTDCTISPGDSGGPLFDMRGKVIGIHSFIASSTTENFHVPVTKFSEDWVRLVKADADEEPRAYIGANAEDDPAGCRLSSVDTNGPAFKGGLRAGDVVIRIAGRDIKAAASYRRWIAESEPGETLKLEVKRGDKSLSLNVTLDSRPPHD